MGSLWARLAFCYWRWLGLPHQCLCSRDAASVCFLSLARTLELFDTKRGAALVLIDTYLR